MERHRLALGFLWLVLACSSAGGAGESTGRNPVRKGDNWITNSTVDRDTSGWQSRCAPDDGTWARWDPRGGRRGSGALCLRVTRTDALADQAHLPVWKYRVVPLPYARRLRCDAWIRGNDCRSAVALGIQVYGADRHVRDGFGSDDSTRLRGTFDWTHVTITADVLPGADRVQVVALLTDLGEAWMDDVVLTDLGPVPELRPERLTNAAEDDSAFLFQVRSAHEVSRGPWRSRVTPSTEPIHVLVALPRADARQIPMDLDLWCEPARCLKSGRLRRQADGNVVADLLLDPSVAPDTGFLGAARPVLVRWQANVLVVPRRLAALATPPRSPGETRAWLTPTPCAQADDPRIAALARHIRSTARSETEIVRYTALLMDSILATANGTAMQFDAVSALDNQGSCVSHANLAAALLRANRIPCRILSGAPTWSPRCGIHLIVEAWLSGLGWVRMDPSRPLGDCWPASEQIVISMASTEAESAGAAYRPGGVSCLHDLAVSEAPDCPDCHIVGVFSQVGEGLETSRIDAVCAASVPATAATTLTRMRDRWRSWIAGEPGESSDGHIRPPFPAGHLEDMLRK